jgi:hypothetical protein
MEEASFYKDDVARLTAVGNFLGSQSVAHPAMVIVLSWLAGWLAAV